MTKKRWDWRPLLTPDELKIVREHEAALKKVETARRPLSALKSEW